MIRLLKRDQIDISKYDRCIENSKQSLIYGFSWYLDIVCDNWCVLVLGDYKAVMPLPVRKKYFIKYVYPPLWMLQLGIFSTVENVEDDFLKVLKKEFWFLELRMNSKNNFRKFQYNANQYQHLNISKNYEEIKAGYGSDRKKDLKKAAKSELKEIWGEDSCLLINLFRNNVGKRTPYILEKDYKVLDNLIAVCLEKGKGELLSIYEKDQLVAAAFFLKHNNEVTILCSSTDFKNRNNGANTFLIDSAIQKFRNDFSIFNFGGSSIKSIANYFTSFGAKTNEYLYLKKRPKLI